MVRLFPFCFFEPLSSPGSVKSWSPKFKRQKLVFQLRIWRLSARATHFQDSLLLLLIIVHAPDAAGAATDTCCRRSVPLWRSLWYSELPTSDSEAEHICF